MLIWNLQFQYFLARYLTPSVCACIDTHLSLQSKRQGRKCRPVLRGMQHPMSDANMEKNGVSVKTKMHKWTKNVFNHLTSGPVCGAFCNTAQSCSIHKTTQIVVGLQQAGPSGTILFAKAALCEPVCMAVTTKKSLSLDFLRGRSTANAQTVCNVIYKDDTLLTLSRLFRPFAHVIFLCHVIAQCWWSEYFQLIWTNSKPIRAFHWRLWPPRCGWNWSPRIASEQRAPKWEEILSFKNWNWNTYMDVEFYSKFTWCLQTCGQLG